MRNEVLMWMEMLSSVKSGTKVTERFVKLKKFAENMVEAAQQEEMLKIVRKQVMLLNL